MFDIECAIEILAALDVCCVCVYMCCCVCGYQCVLEDSGGSTLKSVSSSTAVPSLTLTSASQSNLSVPLTNGTQRSSTSSANLLQVAFDHVSLSTTNMSSSAVGGRRLSLGTLRVNSSQQRQACSSALFVDGSGLLARPAAGSAVDSDLSKRRVASGRSPRVRRKLGKVAGKGRDRRSARASKVTVQSKLPVVDDWLKFDLSAVMSTASVAALPDVAAGDDGSADEDGGLVAAAASFVDANQRAENSELYADFALMTKSVGRFTKLAYPDMYGHVVTPFKEAFYEKRFGTQR